MPERAHVTSIDALESFRASLIIYLAKARPVLEEVAADVVRTRLWLENDQRTYWENQARLRTRNLEQAQQALFSAKISTLRQETAAEQLTVHRAKRARDDADSKLKVLKKWSREYDSRVQPLLKQIEKLQTVLSIDMVKAVASLTQSINSLAAYAAKAPPPAASAAPKATEEVPTGNRGPTQKGTAA